MSASLPDFPALSLDDLSALDTSADLPAAFGERLIDYRRHLHMHPEVGLREHETSRFIRGVLEEAGLTVHAVAGTGLYVDILGAHPGPHVGYRADIDALPIQDAKDAPYRSRNTGVAHLCGHDAHTTVGIGVALLLHRMRDTLRGTVRVFFQPNEEGLPGGATDMIEDGVLDGLEAAYCIHVDPNLPLGRYGLITGAATAAVDQIQVLIRAETTGHSARPHEAKDTIWIANLAMNALYQLIGRVTDPRNASVLTFCRFHAGDAYNVIPAEVDFGGTLRSTSPEDRALLLERIEQVVLQTTRLHGVEAEVRIAPGAPPVLNDGRLVRHVHETARTLFGEEAIYHIPRPSMGAEDFAHFLQHVPGILVRIGTASGPETRFPLHDACFDIDEQALAPTALLMARALAGHLEARLLS